MRDRVKELAGRGYVDPSDDASASCCCSSPTRACTPSSTSTTRRWSTTRSARGRAVLAVHAVRGARRGPPGRRQLPARARLRRDPRVLGGFSQQWQRFSDHIDKLGRQLGTVQRRLRRAGRRPAPPAREASSTRSKTSAPDEGCRRLDDDDEPRRARNPRAAGGERSVALSRDRARPQPSPPSCGCPPGVHELTRDDAPSGSRLIGPGHPSRALCPRRHRDRHPGRGTSDPGSAHL